MKKIFFPTSYNEILKRLIDINPIAYAKSRNHLDGAVTLISPYLTHGVISLPQVRDIVLEKYSIKDSYTFIFELAWREFFQRVYTEEGTHIYNDLKSPQTEVNHYGIPASIINTTTGIQAIDAAYKDLYTNGYMHNHARMWSAMLATNVGHYEWWDVSRHMFYYLLDGDKASNTLSWQWVAGTFSSKKYVANQEMINKFSQQKQRDSYLDTDTSLLTGIYPKELSLSAPFDLKTDFSIFGKACNLSAISGQDVFLYSIWTLDPVWNSASSQATKVLFVDTEELHDFPMSKMRLDFILKLAENIPDIKIVLGTATELCDWAIAYTNNIYRKDHPAIYGWPGIQSNPEYLFPEIINVPRGFMSYWKKCEYYLYK